MTATDAAADTRTARERGKAERRQQILNAAAELIADRGLSGVRLEDLGKAVGISGPAVYRHFANKEAVLEELLVGISEYLLTHGSAVVEAAPTPQAALESLVDFHIDFSLTKPALIRVQGRDLASLDADARHTVRQLQRRYVEIWVRVLCDLDPELSVESARIKAHAGFGALNSTPHSSGRTTPLAAAQGERTRGVLRQMALAALTPSR
ncbi:SACE_7040 family transcriptional regulator [Dermacoccus abyssi]|uniref:SACE_7040 family transcriptional regulator n=1 Tax=Dermacoccus abyssi TaxID=322596 RepID=UPI002AD4465F|nr:TetR/AcrR family transcriptional regulator [Dermacoccus abyssi]